MIVAVDVEALRKELDDRPDELLFLDHEEHEALRRRSIYYYVSTSPYAVIIVPGTHRSRSAYLDPLRAAVQRARSLGKVAE